MGSNPSLSDISRIPLSSHHLSSHELKGPDSNAVLSFLYSPDLPRCRNQFLLSIIPVMFLFKAKTATKRQVVFAGEYHYSWYFLALISSKRKQERNMGK